eukprot:m.87052 g.87052  ORF g.87052 m.87052 type:complete len:312 (+) comp21379_c0_seq1:62-997(+)
MRRAAMRFIDIGANLTDSMYQGVYHGKTKHPPDLEAVLSRSFDAGLNKIIVTAGTLSDAKQALELVGKDARLFTTVGCHPTRCNEFLEDPDKYFADLLASIQANRDKVVAVGECGLDYDRLQFCPKEVQLKYFEKQIALAEATKLPMFLHMRNAGTDFIELMKKHRDRIVAGVVHSFDDSAEVAAELIKLDLCIGINGCSLKTEANITAMCSIPSERLMIETDCPWCEIRPSHAGSKHVKTQFETKKKERFEAGIAVKNRTEPMHIHQVFEVMAAARQEGDPEALAEQIYTTTARMFFGERENSEKVVASE